MSKRICKKCGSIDIRTTKYSNGGRCYVCEDCFCVGLSDDFPEYTVFHEITQSPEVLAEKLVYRITGSGYKVIDSAGRIIAYNNEVWASVIITGEFWTKYEEAIAATVAKLKEAAE